MVSAFELKLGLTARVSDELVVDDVYEPQADLLLQCAVGDRHFLHVFVVADVLVHDLASQLSCLLELLVLEEQLVEGEALLLLLDDLDGQDGDECRREGGGRRAELLERDGRASSKQRNKLQIRWRGAEVCEGDADVC